MTVELGDSDDRPGTARPRRPVTPERRTNAVALTRILELARSGLAPRSARRVRVGNGLFPGSNVAPRGEDRAVSLTYWG